MAEQAEEIIEDMGPSPRRQHYSFAFEFLPWSALNKPENTLSLGVDIPKGILKKTWDRYGEQFPAGERIPPLGLKGEQIRYRNHALVLITMPKPETTAEAFYVGIAYTKQWISDLQNNKETKPDFRCFLFSKNKEEATLREKNDKFHGGLEYCLSPDRTTFLIKIGEHLKDKLEVPLEPTKPAPKQTPPPPKVEDKPKPSVVEESQPDHVQCPPLMEVAHPKLYRENGFRITGLHADATLKELNKRADEIKLMKQLGYDNATNTTAFPLDPLPTLDQVREAMQNLKEPEKRLVDEFFWFWPETFGESSKDEALHALAQGDGARAYDIWSERKGDSVRGAVAYHNLAVLMHMLALDWTRSYIDSTPDEQAAGQIREYWGRANRYWKRTTDNEAIWDIVRNRIRELNDDRLTTGFGRRMRQLLTKALCSIHARLALTYAEQGNADNATTHFGMIQYFKLNIKDQEELYNDLLAPHRKRLLRSVQSIENETKPTIRLETAFSLATEASSQFHLFVFFYGETSEQRSIVFDQVALAILNAVNAYANDSEITEKCVALLRTLLTYAHQVEIRQRITNVIAQGERIVRRESLKPFFDDFKTIEQSKATPEAKLTKVKEYIIPKVMTWIDTEGAQSILSDDLLDGVSLLLRSISIDAFNEHADFNTSQDACNLAIKLSRGSDVKELLQKDKAHLIKIETESSLKLPLTTFGGATIEINRQFCRYRDIAFACSEVIGIRYGVINHYMGNVPTETSYLLSIHGPDRKSITIDFKFTAHDLWINLMKLPVGSSDPGRETYQTILHSLYTHVIPGLLTRLTDKVVSGLEHTMGACVFTSHGLRVTSRALIWKEEKIIPYELINVTSKNGLIYVSYPAKNGTLSIIQSMEVRTFWNAVIIEDLIKNIIKRQ